MIARLLRQLPLRQRIVALILRHFALLDSLTQQLADVIESKRIALEDSTQQLEASAQLIEMGRANATALLRLQGTVLQLTKDLKNLQDATEQLPKELKNLQDGTEQLTRDLKNLQDATEQLQSRSAIYIPANSYELENPEIGLLTYLSGSLRRRVALDIGAHVGEISDRLLDCGMSVHAFEPFPSTFAELSDRLTGRPGFTAHRIAVGSTDGEMDLHIVSATSSESNYKDVREYNSLVMHSLVDGLAFTNSIRVPVRSLQSLHAAREIPDDIGIIKIDAEGYDLEILRGLGDCTSDVLMTEFWDDQHSFGKMGAANRLDELTRELRKSGFTTYLIVYRDAASRRISFCCNMPMSPRGSWGNVLFFKDIQLFAEACRWCASAMPQTFSTG
jgi:FkbM family methyltransferase